MSPYSELKNKRILIVEDVEMNQYLARHIMESWGCVVDVAENGSIAVERVNNQEFDLVLMDIQMPVMDGIEATKKIRSMQDQSKSRIPIVALTANSMKSECDMYLSVGMNDWLGKPFQEPALFDTVKKNLRRENGSNNAVLKQSAKDILPQKKDKLYDLSMVEALSGGDTSFIQRMLLLFLETVPVTLGDMKNAATAGEWQLLSKHAHKLKSTIDSMGISALKQVIREIEAGGKARADASVLREKVEKVIQVMEEVMEEVRRET